MESFLDYYARKDIQKAILESAKDREVSVMYGKGNFGKRPDILQFEGDVFELAKQGATSFHISEEKWADPLQLKPGMKKKELDELRTSWDLIIDIDTKYLEFSKIAAEIIIEALKYNNIQNFSIKFSGSNGFHIGLPYKLFPSNVYNENTKLLFPEAARVIANYLKYLIEKPLREKLLEITTIEELKKTFKPSELIKDNLFDPFSVLELDTVLISNRHLFRAPYSINEKKGLVSIPIKPQQIKTFKITDALPRKIETETKFFDDSKIQEQEASQLFIQAFDWNAKQKPEFKEIKTQKQFETPKIAIKEEMFPPCIKLILNGLKEDGRKRSVFILINFLTTMGYTIDKIQEILLDWNKRNGEQLRDGYIISQINWHKKQSQTAPPPNCKNEAYYKSIAVCKPDNWCKFIKNPSQYATRKLRIINENKK